MNWRCAKTEQWFRECLGAPTAVQQMAWPAIASGEHVLVSAPTGAGKTLAAFLALLDDMKAEGEAGRLRDGLQVIYISPLRALAADIRENLTRPLEGIGADMVRVGVRTGDTPASERQKMLIRPPHILITTPESLYLLLCTVRGRDMLATAKTVIIDELHALISTKRGSHLMLSLARLDALTDKPVQRIGLSATIRPLDLAAEYLANGAPVRVVAPAARKRADIAVTGVLPDMRVLPEGTIWPELARQVARACRGQRTVIAFMEGRAQAERLAAAVNEIEGEGFALAHHGSVSREKRQQAEAALRSGKLRLLCATSSMELGIDVGAVDLVLQVGCPLTVSSALQRMGRAGHSPGRVSVMRVYPKTASDGLWCALTADAALSGAIEPARPPRMCLDVLAQHLVSMAADGGYTVDGALNVIRGAWPTRDISRADLTALLRMLAGDWEHDQDRPARPRLLYDRINDTVTGDAYTRLLALSAGGTIPDRGLFPAVLPDGTRVGELDEEFVFEARIGDRFLLGAFAWQIEQITRDRVVVSQASGAGAQAPFWRGDGAGRDYGVSERFGAALRSMQDGRDLQEKLTALHMDAWAAQNAARHLRDQMTATGCLPDDETIVVEHFSDDAGEHQMMVHSVFGRRVNEGLAMLLRQKAVEALNCDVRYYDDDNGALVYAIGTRDIPEGLVQALDPSRTRAILTALMPATPLFSMAFRYNAGRALMFGARSGRRQALWVQRLRGAETLSTVVGDADHPLMRETLRECLEDYLDIDALNDVLEGVRAGKIAVRELHVETPSPMALPMRRQVEAEMMYDYAPIPRAANAAAADALKRAVEMCNAIAPDPNLLNAQYRDRRAPESIERLHSLMMTEGDFAAGEVDAPIEWLEALSRAGRCRYIEPGLWIPAEMTGDYLRAAQERDAEKQARIARRCLRYRGPQSAQSLRERYGWHEDDCDAALEALAEGGTAVKDGELYFHAEVYERARRQTVIARRSAIETLPPSRYAALLARGLRAPGRPADQLRAAVEALADWPFPIRQWEEALLPARVRDYRPALLDELISRGEYLWRLEDGRLSLHRSERVDWDAPPLWRAGTERIEEDEAAVLAALEKRGASFAAALAGLARTQPIGRVLLELASKGLVRADSFAPLRALNALEGGAAQSPRQQSRLWAAACQSGRWELARPLIPPDDEACLMLDFATRKLVCRETVRRLSWARAWELLRVWEYTGRARRGYFVGGISGIQFVLNSDFAAVTAGLNAHDDDPVWLQANDPAQAWGSALNHEAGRGFLCVPGTAVCLLDGVPAAVLEQGGKRLRVFEPEYAARALAALTRDYRSGYVFSGRERLTIKEGASGFEDALRGAGWMPEALDWTLWKRP